PVVERGEHGLGERIGAGVRLVEREPGDAVLVAGEPPVAPGRARALAAGERTELEIARRENVPDFTHLLSCPRDLILVDVRVPDAVQRHSASKTRVNALNGGAPLIRDRPRP